MQRVKRCSARKFAPERMVAAGEAPRCEALSPLAPAALVRRAAPI